VEIIETVAVSPRELDELSCSLDDGTTLGSPRNRDASAAPEVEKSFLSSRAPARRPHLSR
jgi:hypothetical protein